jgi:hypothetical protein
MYVEVTRPCGAIKMLCRIEEAAGQRGRLRVSVTINKGLHVHGVPATSVGADNGELVVVVEEAVGTKEREEVLQEARERQLQRSA